MSKRSFTLADLVPDPITIRIGDKSYRGRNADEMSVVDAVKIGWMQDELNQVQEQLNDTEAIAAMSKEDQIALAESAASLLDQMLKLIIPDITDEDLTFAPFVRKLGLAQQWQIWQQEAQQGKSKVVRAGRAKHR